MRDTYIIGNPVPTPEEMAEILGLTSERVAAVRRIMNAPSSRKASTRSSGTFRSAAAKKSSRVRTTARLAVKR